MNLADAQPNTVVTIIDIDAGPGLKARLLGMGFVSGAKLKVIENRDGHIVVALDSGYGRVVALSKGIAKKIIVASSTV
ncbi:FeoA domain-containing protein [Ignisphaera sp. 4213-co]|uniref:FeoA domain-containing protein n=1 Tax=Ignisphaera cupida TaxID=3050454 RepID=A0ABD4Z799_9CREN|nr:FeoA domain-containing protein [Ignisphaera sp. 4213-co]MDK6028755.1 FeoA domain-containing protein [Ignisphaera sp. 4213-co]